nr:TetR/AcrR family transcriptional regulator [uncultured Lichenicoccus sp.]
MPSDTIPRPTRPSRYQRTRHAPDEPKPVRHSGNRHGRSEEARLAVLQASDDLLLERGFANLSVEAIAAKAGVAKQTIYRWWASKTDILFDAFDADAEEYFRPADHGDLDGDLRDLMRQLASFLGQPDTRAVFRALAGQAQHDPTAEIRFRDQVIDRLRVREHTALERGVARGELPAGSDLELSLDELTGPVFFRTLLGDGDLGPDFVDRLVDRWLARSAAAGA